MAITAAAAVAVVLGLLHLPSALDRSNAAYENRLPFDSPTGRTIGAALEQNSIWRGEPLTLIRVSGVTEAPPGVARLPNAGQAVVSPALAEVMADHRDELAERVPGTIIGTIAAAGLRSDDELVAYVGVDDDRRLLRLTGWGLPSGVTLATNPIPAITWSLLAIFALTAPIVVLRLLIQLTRWQRRGIQETFANLGAPEALFNRSIAVECVPYLAIGAAVGGTFGYGMFWRFAGSLPTKFGISRPPTSIMLVLVGILALGMAVGLSFLVPALRAERLKGTRHLAVGALVAATVITLGPRFRPGEAPLVQFGAALVLLMAAPLLSDSLSDRLGHRLGISDRAGFVSGFAGRLSSGGRRTSRASQRTLYLTVVLVAVGGSVSAVFSAAAASSDAKIASASPEEVLYVSSVSPPPRELRDQVESIQRVTIVDSARLGLGSGATVMIECVDPSVVPIADCPARGSVLLLTTAQNVESITVVDQSLQAVTASRPDYLLLPPDLMGMSDANYLFVATTDFDRIDAISDSAYSNSVMQLATQDAAALELARDLAFQDAGLDLHDDSSPIGNAATGAEIGGVSQRFDDITRRLSGYFYGYILGLLAIAMFVGVLLETMYHARTTRILAETGASRRTVASAFMVASLLPSLLCLLCAVVVGYFVGARYAAWTDYSVNLHVFGPGILAAGLLLIVLSGAASALATHHLV